MRLWSQIFSLLFLLLLSGKGWAAVLDLRDEQFAKSRLLDMPWEYSDRPILPGRFTVGDEAAKPQNFWLEGANLPQRGYFRLTILRHADQTPIRIVFKDMPALRVLINGQEQLTQGKLYGEDGDVENARGDSTVLLPQSDEVEVILELGATLPRWNFASYEIQIGPEDVLRKETLLDAIVLAIMLGGLFITGIYHISLYVMTPSRSATLTLGLFCIVNCIRSSITGKVDSVFNFFPNFPYELSYKMAYIGYYLAPPLFIEFLRVSFPGTISKRVARALWVFTATFVILTLFVPVDVYGRWNTVFHIGTVANIITAFYGLIKAIKSRAKGSIILLVAVTMIAAATFNDVMYAERLPSIGPIIHVALFLFILMQSLILSSQFSVAFAELAHTYKEFTKIVYLHTVKQIANGFEIEKTMRVGTAEAVVVAFDIVGSSRIKHPGFSDAVERMMGRCYDAMSHGYDAQDMQCRAYRVKEMGDGLLCSVGFPFPTGEGRTEASVANDLAAEFVRIFKEEFEKLELDSNSYCGIGIAKGSVEGFFPRFGVKQYDLRGKTIMLATRYEAMRNAVYSKIGWNGSVIFIQDEVYQDLLPDERAHYSEWDATVDGQRIRDDGLAQKAWYRFAPCAERKGGVGVEAIEIDVTDLPKAV